MVESMLQRNGTHKGWRGTRPKMHCEQMRQVNCVAKERADVLNNAVVDSDLQKATARADGGR